jgi:glycosyltransferase involved in cell wall biosynthesis
MGELLDLVDDGKTGFGYEFESSEALVNILLRIAKSPEEINAMRLSCVNRAKDFLPSEGMKPIVKFITE